MPRSTNDIIAELKVEFTPKDMELFHEYVTSIGIENLKTSDLDHLANEVGLRTFVAFDFATFYSIAASNETNKKSETINRTMLKLTKAMALMTLIVTIATIAMWIQA